MFKVFGSLVVVGLLIRFTIIGLIVWAAWHFISKYW